ncbi:capsid and scaffold [Enterobacter phage 03_vB_Eclo_IJM]|nr:capsid and scaffold [Enterobacter phage 03_vB_Eclo_IJM]
MTSPLSKLNTLRRVSCPRHPTLSWLRPATPSVFVDSFVRGQEALAEQYAAGVVRYAGGAEQFNRICLTLRPTTSRPRRPLSPPSSVRTW